jgi:hypothetical protein
VVLREHPWPAPLHWRMGIFPRQSWRCSLRTPSRWTRSFSPTVAGSIVRRSLTLLPWRTVIYRTGVGSPRHAPVTAMPPSTAVRPRTARQPSAPPRHPAAPALLSRLPRSAMDRPSPTPSPPAVVVARAGRCVHHGTMPSSTSRHRLARSMDIPFALTLSPDQDPPAHGSTNQAR